ncbi:MAG: membrane protein insertion efficiency factor YidD [candidate division Zixibacteria bacterium RBG_16_40_9]|nr:MAG: membrane protein insertion efficiency factor YidD [candidate division Zixibacteria bacterium RBG_16_40_9]
MIFIIKIYQNSLGLIFPNSCRFYPSCSEYGILALEKFGLLKGIWLIVKRISKCHPFHPGGYDPV